MIIQTKKMIGIYCESSQQYERLHFFDVPIQRFFFFLWFAAWSGHVIRSCSTKSGADIKLKLFHLDKLGKKKRFCTPITTPPACTIYTKHSTSIVSGFTWVQYLLYIYQYRLDFFPVLKEMCTVHEDFLCIPWFPPKNMPWVCMNMCACVFPSTTLNMINCWMNK